MTMRQRASKIGGGPHSEVGDDTQAFKSDGAGLNPGSCAPPARVTEAFSRLAEPHVSHRCSGAQRVGLSGISDSSKALALCTAERS